MGKITNEFDLNKKIDSFLSGNCTDAYEFLGCHLKGKDCVFRVWAPRANSVGVVGDFNHWDRTRSYMNKISDAGIWELFVEGIKQYDTYKYSIESTDGLIKLKADPYGYHMELRPNTASKFYELDGFKWTDGKYMEALAKKNIYDSAANIYEVNIGSWKKDGESYYDYKRLADELIPYVKDMEEDFKRAEKARVCITHSGISQEIVDEVKTYLESLKHF